MTVFRDTSAALDSRMQAFLDTLPEPPDVAWENRTYSPMIGTPWMRPTLIPGDVRPSSIGAAGRDEADILYQIDVFTEYGVGKAEGIDLADKVATHFKRGTVLTYGGTTITVKAASRQAARQDNGWWAQSVLVSAYAVSNQR